MHRGRLSVAATALALVVVVPLSLVWANPAAANHDQDEDQLWVTVAINAAGSDSISVTDNSESVDGPFTGLVTDAAIALGHRPGSFRTIEDHDRAYVELEDKLAQPDPRSGLSWEVDSGNLQLLAQQEGFEVLLLQVCTPKVRQVVNALITPESSGLASPGTRCRGWYLYVDDPAIRAVVELSPDRDRYPLAVGRAVGIAAMAFGIIGIGATLLRRGPLRRRSALSWVLGAGAAVLVGLLGWATVTIVIWWNGSANDPVMLSRGSILEQVARTMVPGLVFVLPALLPAVLLLSVPPGDPPPPPVWPGVAPQEATWWPQPWWSQWAAQHPQGQQLPPGQAGPGSTPAPPAGGPPAGPAAPPPGGSSGWAAPESSGD